MTESDRKGTGDVVAHLSPVSVAVVVVVALFGFGGAYTTAELSGEAIVGTGALLTIAVGVLSLYTQSSNQFNSVTGGGIWAMIASVVIFIMYSGVFYVAVSIGVGTETSTIASVIVVLLTEEVIRILFFDDIPTTHG